MTCKENVVAMIFLVFFVLYGMAFTLLPECSWAERKWCWYTDRAGAVIKGHDALKPGLWLDRSLNGVAEQLGFDNGNDAQHTKTVFDNADGVVNGFGEKSCLRNAII